MSGFHKDLFRGEHMAIPTSNPAKGSNPRSSSELLDEHSACRISVPEIVRLLEIGRLAVYSMLEQGIIPGIRLGRRWIITRHAYEEWERTCGMPSGAGLRAQPEVR